MKIQLITAEETYPLRHRVLKPYLSTPLDTQLDGDLLASSIHIGVFIDDQLVTIASFFQENHKQFPDFHNAYRLRGMATDAKYAGQGLGRKAIEFAIELLKNRHCDLIWCHAREKAFGFYEKIDFQFFGELFDIPQIGPYKIMYKNIPTTEIRKSNTELLLPVGNMEMALAAIHNGADAIYVGTPGFNARGRSYDHNLDELKEIIETCHLYGVKVNLALNIVIFENEISKVHELLKEILPLKPDALIIQDLGLAKLVRDMAPDQAIHGSTQMTITNQDAIHFIDDLKLKRIVLGRENSIDEIKIIRQNTKKELEVFVHGALCVSYSGQCFTSESIGGRSANRGQCAQSCRFSYDLIVDGQKQNQLDRNYLVSPQDLCGIEQLPELIEAGVNTFKIEGRLKTPEYVASAAHEYRHAIDQYFLNQKLSPDEIAEAKKNMAVTYSRGFFSGWLKGVDHQQLVEGTFSNHRGYEIGRISKLNQHSIFIQIKENLNLAPGDGLKWAAYHHSKLIEGGAQIYSCEKLNAQSWKIDFQRDIILQPELTNARLYLNHDHLLKKNLVKSFNDKNFFKKVGIDLRVIIQEGQPLIVTAFDGDHFITAKSSVAVEKANKKGVDEQLIKEELSALSSTIYKANNISIENQTQTAFYIHQKELKLIRRNLCDQLDEIRKNRRISQVETILIEQDQNFNHRKNSVQKNDRQTKLNILLRNKKQVLDFHQAMQTDRFDLNRIHTVILDFEFGRDYEESLTLLRTTPVKVGIATTRILKPKEYNNLKVLMRLNPDFILARNLGAIHYLQNEKYSGKIIGDFSLNVTNHLSAEYLLSKNLHSLCSSYDLNVQQIDLLMNQMNSDKLEITAHQYMPSFHMEHCVFAAFLSKGSSFRDCGKPCEKHRVELKDQFGNHHQIKADQECRNTMFNSIAQTAAKEITRWQENGLGFIRYEALYEEGEELVLKISAYLDLLNNKTTSESLVSKLKLNEKYGLGSGAIGIEKEYQSRKKS